MRWHSVSVHPHMSMFLDDVAEFLRFGVGDSFRGIVSALFVQTLWCPKFAPPPWCGAAGSVYDGTKNLSFIYPTC